LRRQVVPDNLAKDVLLANAAGDQLSVLRAKIEDQDALTLGSERGGGGSHGKAFAGQISFPTRFPCLFRIPIPRSGKDPDPASRALAQDAQPRCGEREKSIIPRRRETSKPS